MTDEVRTRLEQQGIVMNQSWPRLGILTGLSPQSSKEYYIKLCDTVSERLGNGNGNVPLFTAQNINFGLIEALMKMNEWDAVKEVIDNAISRLEDSGAQAVAVCSNTIHRVLEDMTERHHAPLIHIGDCVAAEIKRLELSRVGFLGTATSMSEEFMLGHLEKSGAEIFVPDESACREIDRIIFEELCRDVAYRDESRTMILDTISDMITKYSIEGVILGCTELPLIINESVQEHFCLATSTPIGFRFIDSETVHIEAIADYCCNRKLPQLQ